MSNFSASAVVKPKIGVSVTAGGNYGREPKDYLVLCKWD